MKVVYNACWGGFDVPSALRPHNKEHYWDYSPKRDDPELVKFVEDHGGIWQDKRRITKLKIAIIPETPPTT